MPSASHSAGDETVQGQLEGSFSAPFIRSIFGVSIQSSELQESWNEFHYKRLLGRRQTRRNHTVVIVSIHGLPRCSFLEKAVSSGGSCHSLLRLRYCIKSYSIACSRQLLNGTKNIFLSDDVRTFCLNPAMNTGRRWSLTSFKIVNLLYISTRNFRYMTTLFSNDFHYDA